MGERNTGDMKQKLPAELENIKDGPHKRDMIRHYLKERRKCGK